MTPIGAGAYYAVAIGRVPGVYRSWTECREMIQGVRNARFKKFATEPEALAFIASVGAGGSCCSSVLAQMGIVPTVTETAERRRVADGGAPLTGFVCFTDGACSANGRAGARAAYAAIWPDAPENNVAARLPGPVQTNNRAEYTAALAALDRADALDPARLQPMTLWTDSKLLINSVTKWMPGWRRRNWRKPDGTEVANVDLLQRLSEHCRSRTVHWRYVAAHTGGVDYASHWNNVADRAAVAALDADAS